MTQWIDRGDGVKLAYLMTAGRGPTLVFLPGFRSDMRGAKAQALASWCAGQGRAMLRLDYSGHGESEGLFEAGSIGRWADDAALLIERLVPGPRLLVGSSMGGWIALLLGLRLAQVRGLILIAPAPDFAHELLWPSLSTAQQQALTTQGALTLPGPEGFTVTRRFFEEAEQHRLLGGEIAFAGRVRLLHGQADRAVPWQTSLRIAERLRAPDVRVTLVKDGDHRLSRPADLALLTGLLGEDGP